MSIGGAYMYMGLGYYAQDPSVHYGKLLRLDSDGAPAADNPFLGSGEFLPEAYSVGHRNQIGMDFHPQTGELWASENGPQEAMRSTLSGPMPTMVGRGFLTAGSIVATGSATGNGRATLFSLKSSGGRQLRRRDWLSTQGIKSSHGRVTCLWVLCCKAASRVRGMSNG